MDNRNRITESMIENLARRMRRKRMLRRGLALLSALVLLFTMNTLKFQADTLERIPTCGLEEHLHGPECYAEDGATLVCNLPEHVHTDACYQQRPVTDAEPPADDDIVSEDVEAGADEVDMDLSDSGLEDSSDAQEAAAVESAEQSGEYT